MMTALRVHERTNQRDLAGLTALMTDDHALNDNAGDVDTHMAQG